VSKHQTGNALVALLLWIGLALVSLWGWIWNIMKLYDLGLDPLTGEVVLRVIGIFVAPIGVVMGYL
jgi:hypothetical protein